MSQTEHQLFHTILVPLPIFFIFTWLELLPRHGEVLLRAFASFILCWLHPVEIAVLGFRNLEVYLCGRARVLQFDGLEL